MAENNRERDKSTHGFRPKDKTRYADAHGSVTDDFLKRRQTGRNADSYQEKTSTGNAQKRGSEEAAFNPGERSVYVDAQGSITEEILKRQQQKDDGYFVEGEQIGSFTVISRLGEGASGTVYKVKNSLGDIEALKIAPPELLGTPAARKNFMRELRAARKLHHPHLVPIHNVDKIAETNDIFFTMPFMQGGDLDMKLEQNQRHLPSADILKWMGQVAQALAFVHSRNLVHQDIKPANILIDGEGNAFLGDFGLAFKYMTDSLKQNLTRSSRPGGTTYFMSPEQQQAVFRGVKSDISAASDIYAFGLTLYTLLSGEFVQIFPKPLSTFIENKPLADRLDKLLRRCWESDPQKRFKNGSELLAAWPSGSVSTPPAPSQPLPHKSAPPQQPTGKGDLALSTNQDAAIYLDGKLQGNTKACYLLLRDIPYGEHRIKAETRTQIAEKPFKQDADVVQESLELKAKLGRLKVLSEIGFFEVKVLGTTFKAPTALRKVPAGEHKLSIKYKELEFSHDIYVKANQVTEYMLTHEILQTEKKRAAQKAIAELLNAAPNTLSGQSKLLAELKALEKKTDDSLKPQLNKVMENVREELSKLKRVQLEEERRKQAERDSHVYELARKEGTEEALREYIANYKLHQAEARELLSELKREPKAGEKKSFAIPGTSIALDMRWIPRGRFLMGSPESEGNRRDDELQHWVTLSKGFWMLETQVTQEMWVTLMGGNPSYYDGRTLWERLTGKPPRSKLKNAKRPVESVSWEDVQKFIEKLNSKGIGRYRLPTEAEWEYACRAGSTSAYCYGNSESELKDYAWYGEGIFKEKTHTVGGKQANGWGLYDMHGNVWEWCEDWYGEDYYKESLECDPRGPASGEYRVYRGGCCWINAGNCRSAYRYWNAPDNRDWSLGFRLARNYP